MRIYVYVSQQDPDVLGFTSDETGANLPDGHGPWREEVMPGVVVIDTDDDPIAEAVRLEIKTAAPSAREPIPADAIPPVTPTAMNAARIIPFIGISISRRATCPASPHMGLSCRMTML